MKSLAPEAMPATLPFQSLPKRAKMPSTVGTLCKEERHRHERLPFPLG
ncbi:hypothetical protein QOZ99_002798 [Angulomicrobium amanitiforme]|uniref:Uncharacterized protein n=1 Tax=Ancylobacter amanitiformis TaxID=217069 RepID=A0ABU0LT96_9HYPH|nr:hypothetical protein [Ancylobacter amanitiformis]